MSSHVTCRIHSIRIEQQPLGGANAIVFHSDLHIGGIKLFLDAILKKNHVQILYVLLFGLQRSLPSSQDVNQDLLSA